ncbi:ECF RNA polymerase sigma-E factor [compost metagenome]
MQDSFIRAYRQIGRFEARSNFGTWLHRIVVNCAMDVLRARVSRREALGSPPAEDGGESMLTSAAPSPERLARSAEIRRHVDSSLALLTADERVAFTLRHYEGRSIDEIGRTMGLQKSAAKHAVFRAVRKLRDALEPLRRET